MLIKLLILLLLGVGAWWTLLYLMQDAMLFPRDYAPPAPAQRPDYATGQLTTPVPEGLVEAYLCTPQPAGPSPGPHPTVIFFHGNAEIIDQQHDIVSMYHALGYAVLLPEYRGYGRSAGLPSQRNIAQDMLAFHRQLVELPSVDASRVVYHGRSVGAAVAIDLATRRPPAALIIESAFDSIPSMASRYFAPGFLARNPFRNDRALARANFPVLQFHGVHDDIVPVTHAHRLRDVIPRVTYIEYPCGHNDLPPQVHRTDYERRIAEFLRASLNNVR